MTRKRASHRYTVWDAAKKGDVAFLEEFLEMFPSEIDLRDAIGMTPLLWAAARSQDAAVELLLSKGASPLLTDFESGWTPLHHALYAAIRGKGELSTAVTLLSPSPPSPSSASVNAAALSSLAKDSGNAALLIQDKDGYTPLDLLSPSALPETVFARRLSAIGGAEGKGGTAGRGEKKEKERGRERGRQREGKDTPGGTLYSWGYGGSFQLGSDRLDSSGCIRTPKEIEAMEVTEVRAIAASKYHSLALSEGGKVYSFGHGEALGLSQSKSSEAKTEKRKRTVIHPTVVTALSRTRVVQVACGKYHSGALSEDGDVFTWGKNRFGQLGHPLDRDPAVGDPFLVAEPRKIVLKEGMRACFLATSNVHSVIITTSGAALTFGSNRFGALARLVASAGGSSTAGTAGASSSSTSSSAMHFPASLSTTPASSSLLSSSSHAHGSALNVVALPNNCDYTPRKVNLSESLRWVLAAVSKRHTLLLSDDGDVYSVGFQSEAEPYPRKVRVPKTKGLLRQSGGIAASPSLFSFGSRPSLSNSLPLEDPTLFAFTGSPGAIVSPSPSSSPFGVPFIPSPLPFRDLAAGPLCSFAVTLTGDVFWWKSDGSSPVLPTTAPSFSASFGTSAEGGRMGEFVEVGAAPSAFPPSSAASSSSKKESKGKRGRGPISTLRLFLRRRDEGAVKVSANPSLKYEGRAKDRYLIALIVTEEGNVEEVRCGFQEQTYQSSSSLPHLKKGSTPLFCFHPDLGRKKITKKASKKEGKGEGKVGRGGGERTETDLKNLSDRPFVLSVEQLPSLRGVTKVSCGYRHSLAVVEPLRSTELWKAVEERERERRKRRLGRGTESLFGGFEREGEEDREEDEEEMREDRERKGKRDGRKGVLSSFSLLPPSMKHSGMAVPSLKRICERAIASNPSILDLGSALEVLDAALQLRSRFLCSEALELIVRNLDVLLDWLSRTPHDTPKYLWSVVSQELASGVDFYGEWLRLVREGIGKKEAMAVMEESKRSSRRTNAPSSRSLLREDLRPVLEEEESDDDREEEEEDFPWEVRFDEVDEDGEGEEGREAEGKEEGDDMTIFFGDFDEEEEEAFEAERRSRERREREERAAAAAEARERAERDEESNRFSRRTETALERRMIQLAIAESAKEARRAELERRKKEEEKGSGSEETAKTAKTEVQKKLRAVRKKLRQIDVLKRRIENGDSLNAEESRKVEQEQELWSEVVTLEKAEEEEKTTAAKSGAVTGQGRRKEDEEEETNKERGLEGLIRENGGKKKGKAKAAEGKESTMEIASASEKERVRSENEKIEPSNAKETERKGWAVSRASPSLPSSSFPSHLPPSFCSSGVALSTSSVAAPSLREIMSREESRKNAQQSVQRKWEQQKLAFPSPNEQITTDVSRQEEKSVAAVTNGEEKERKGEEAGKAKAKAKGKGEGERTRQLSVEKRANTMKESKREKKESKREENETTERREHQRERGKRVDERREKEREKGNRNGDASEKRKGDHIAKNENRHRKMRQNVEEKEERANEKGRKASAKEKEGEKGGEGPTRRQRREAAKTTNKGEKQPLPVGSTGTRKEETKGEKRQKGDKNGRATEQTGEQDQTKEQMAPSSDPTATPSLASVRKDDTSSSAKKKPKKKGAFTMSLQDFFAAPSSSAASTMPVAPRNVWGEREAADKTVFFGKEQKPSPISLSSIQREQQREREAGKTARITTVPTSSVWKA